MYDELVKRLRAAKAVVFKTEDVTLLGDAADAIEELSRRCEQFQYMPPPAWISMTERLPEENAPCIVFNKYYGPMVAWRVDGERFRIPGSRFPDHPTHWMPLPEPPKEEA